MNSKNSVYALAAVTALAFGLGMSFWRSTVDNARLVRANRIAEMAQLTAEDDLRTLHDKLRRAEAAQTVAETSERTLPDKLSRETAARQTADAAREEAQSALKVLTAKFSDETAARKSAEGALFTAVDQVRILSTKLAEVLIRREADSAKTGAEPGTKAPDEKSEAAASKDEQGERGTDATPVTDQNSSRIAAAANSGGPGRDGGESRVNGQEPAQPAVAVQ